MSTHTAIGTSAAAIGGSVINWIAYWLARYADTLTITITSDTQATWNWVLHGTADYDDIRLERGTTLLNFTEIDDVALGTTTYADGGLTPQTYYFRLRLRRGTHYSAYSNVVSVVENDFYVAIGARVTTTGAARITTDSKYRIVA